MTVAEAKAYLAEGTHFAKGSMAPKIQAGVQYLENGGKLVIITDPPTSGDAVTERPAPESSHDTR